MSTVRWDVLLKTKLSWSDRTDYTDYRVSSGKLGTAQFSDMILQFHSCLSSKEKGEASADIRARIETARDVQTRRFSNAKGLHTNAQMESKQIRNYCVIDEKGDELRICLDSI